MTYGASPDADRAGGPTDPSRDASRPEALIPSADAIPDGPYCYTSLGPMDSEGFLPIKGQCPYWESRPDEHAYCRYLNYETEFGRELLWDQVKCCGVRDGF